jgi:hypothetical protein
MVESGGTGGSEGPVLTVSQGEMETGAASSDPASGENVDNGGLQTVSRNAAETAIAESAEGSPRQGPEAEGEGLSYTENAGVLVGIHDTITEAQQAGLPPREALALIAQGAQASESNQARAGYVEAMDRLERSIRASDRLAALQIRKAVAKHTRATKMNAVRDAEGRGAKPDAFSHHRNSIEQQYTESLSRFDAEQKRLMDSDPTITEDYVEALSVESYAQKLFPDVDHITLQEDPIGAIQSGFASLAELQQSDPSAFEQQSDRLLAALNADVPEGQRLSRDDISEISSIMKASSQEVSEASDDTDGRKRRREIINKCMGIGILGLIMVYAIAQRAARDTR